MPNSNRKKKILVFLSHANEDKPTIRKLCQRLKSEGFDPWLDEERILPGQDWKLEIEKALRNSDAILVNFSKKSLAKEGYIQREYKNALDYQKEKPEGTIFVIPVRLDNCEIPFYLQDLQCVDYPSGYERLLMSLNVRAGKAVSVTKAAVLKPQTIQSYSEKNESPEEDERQVRLVLEGNFDEFNETRKEDLISVLASILKVDSESIRVLQVYSGSVIVVVKMPKIASERLVKLALSKDFRLKAKGIMSIKVENEPAILLSAKEADYSDNTLTTSGKGFINRKLIPNIMIVIGIVLLISSVILWLVSNANPSPHNLGLSITDWITLFTAILGLGASAKGWIDLFTKDKPTSPTSQIDIKGNTPQIATGEHARNIQTETYIEKQVIQNLGKIGEIDSNIELTSEEEEFYLDKYLNDVERTTRKLPWDYALGSISPEIEISKIYVSPSFAHQEYQRAVQVIMDEKQEREQERREKKVISQSSSFVRPILVDVYDIIRSKNPIAIIGYMGTGKSLASSYMAWLLAKRENTGMVGFSHPKTPIIVKLGDQLVMESSDLTATIFEVATKHFPPNEKTKLIKVLRKEWETGNVVLILDALDEYAGRLDWIKNEIEHLVENTTHGNHVILTSRPSMYRLVKPAGFKIFELNEIESSTLDRYITKWVKALLETSESTNSSVETHIEYLKSQISSHPLVEDMVSNPLLLTILIALSLTKGGLDLSKVKNETDLFSQYIDRIIEREKFKSSFVSIENGSDLMLRVVYGYTGLLVHRARTQQDPEFPDVQYLVEKISSTRYFSKISNGVALTEACLDFWEKAGLFVDKENTNKRIGFRHQAFQFFGAALGLVFLTEETRESLLRTVGNDPQWIDVLRLFLGVKPTSDLKLE